MPIQRARTFNLTWLQSVWPDIPLQDFVWEPVAVQRTSSAVGQIHLVPEHPWRPYTTLVKFDHPAGLSVRLLGRNPGLSPSCGPGHVGVAPVLLCLL
ncbi:MAG: hypothetical protein ACYCOU_13795 [Sulfobacillus sp.]